MKLKPGVQVGGLQPVMMIALLAAHKAITMECSAELLITSAGDGRHSSRSKHYLGLAIDLRSKHLHPDEKEQVLAELRQALGDQFDVLLEGQGTPNEHFHIEFDPKRTAPV